MKSFVAIIVVGVAIVFIATSFTYRSNSKCDLHIHFDSYVGNSPLKLDTATYKNGLEQAFTVSKLKYYIGNIRLEKKDHSIYTSKEYFLINEDEPDSKTILLKDVPEGEYLSITYILGVDSLHNCSGAQSGTLDPLNGMFWTWNTGYIFFKLEGKSPASKSPGQIFEFHIGGYKGEHNCIRQINLPISKRLVVKPSKPNLLEIKADVSQVLESPVSIDFSNLSSVTDFHNATMLADNYKDMFSIMNTK